MNKLTRRATLGAATAFALTQGTAAQAYPNKPIRVLVPYPVGGIVDIVTRAVAEPMQTDLGQPVVVEPKPGGNSTLATAMIPQAPADGYTCLMATISHVVVPHLQSVPYDALADFQPIAVVAVATAVAAVNPSVPVKTLKELVEYGKANPGKLHYLNPGNGSSIHLSSELLKNQYKFDMTSVPIAASRRDCPTCWKAACRSACCPQRWPFNMSRAANCGRWPFWPTSGSRPCPTCRPSPKRASPMPRS